MIMAYNPTRVKPVDPRHLSGDIIKSNNQSINQLSTCLISISTDSKAHHPIHKTLDMFRVVPGEVVRCSVVRSYGGNDF